MKFTLSFVISGLAALGAVHAAPLEARSSSTVANIDTTILQFALYLENLEAFFYKQALARFSADDFKNAGYPAQVRQRIVEVGAEEAIHATTLASVIGKKALKPCQYTFPYETVEEFLALSAVIEGVGVSAYLGAAPLITSKDYLLAAGSILTIEARHQSTISTFLEVDPVPSAFDTPLGINPVYTLASQFVVKCPASNAKLPVMAYPAATLSNPSPQPGDHITISFKAPKHSKNLYAQFINGLSTVSVKLGHNNSVKVPAGLTGRTYVIITSGRAYSDKATVAGPALFDVGQDDL